MVDFKRKLNSTSEEHVSTEMKLVPNKIGKLAFKRLKAILNISEHQTMAVQKALRGISMDSI